MIDLAAVTFDGSALIALATLAASVTAALLGYRKIKPEAEAIATRTALEVIETLREELLEQRKENREAREALRKRDEQVEHLQQRVGALRHEVDVLEAQVNALTAE